MVRKVAIGDTIKNEYGYEFIITGFYLVNEEKLRVSCVPKKN